MNLIEHELALTTHCTVSKWVALDVTSASFAFNSSHGCGATLTRTAQRYACCVYREQALILSDVTTKLKRILTWIIHLPLAHFTWDYTSAPSKLLSRDFGSLCLQIGSKEFEKLRQNGAFLVHSAISMPKIYGFGTRPSWLVYIQICTIGPA